MVLEVISKKIATEEGPKVIFGLGVGVVIIGTFSAMGQVSAEEKELKSRQDRWHHPKDNQIFSGNEKFQHVKCNRHQQNLPNRDILLDKTEVPDQKSS